MAKEEEHKKQDKPEDVKEKKEANDKKSKAPEAAKDAQAVASK